MTTPSSCDPEILAAYLEGALSEAQREVFELHAGSCPRCQEALLSVVPEAPVAVRRRSWAPALAVAAGLLLILSIARHPDGSRTLPGGIPVPSPRPEVATPRRQLGRAGVPEACVATGLDLVTEADARLEIPDRGHLVLERGMAWLEVLSGEPIQLDAGGPALSLARGTLAVRRRPAPSAPLARRWSPFLSEAVAGEATPAAEAWILDGEARSGTRTFVAGTRLVLDAGLWTPAPFPEAEGIRLGEARTAAVAALEGESPTAGLQGPFRWVGVFTGRDPATEVGISIAVEGRCFQWVPGLAAKPPRAREVVEIRWDGVLLTGRTNGRTVLSLRREALDQGALPASQAAPWQVTVWNGRATLAQSRVLRETQP